MKVKSGKVLIVDDDENICEVINMYLKSAGYETKKCVNGKDACNSYLKSYKPDISFIRCNVTRNRWN